MTSYRFRPVPAATLGELRTRDDAGQVRAGYVDDEGGAPLRCCLRRSRPGESIMLVSYAPLRRWARATGADPGPYEELGPVFIHAEPCAGSGDDFPVELLSARRVFRAYDARGHILGGSTVDPAPGHADTVADAALDASFADPAVALVHVRAVEFGCFFTEVRRPG